MMNYAELASTPSDHPAPFTDQLRLAVAGYLARFKGSSREHTESDLRCYLSWCAGHGLDPLAARRPQLELYIRWMQEVRRFKPSTVSRRFSVTAGFYRTCVIDGLLEHSPAEHVRRPSVPAESPTLGFTHLQFEALLTAARQSPHPCDFALVAMLGLLGLRIFEATGTDIADLGEEHGHRVLRVCGKGTKIVLIPLPPAVGRAIDRAIGARTRGPILLNSRGARMDRHAATRRLRRLAGTAGIRTARAHPHMLRHTYAQRHADAGVPIDVLAGLLDHRDLDITRGYYRVGEDRRRDAVDKVTALQFDRHGNRIWRGARTLLDAEHARYAVGQVAVPYGTCSEPSNVAAGGGACPVRYRCAGCDHFRTDVSYLPDLTAHLDDLLRTRERLAAASGIDDWARADATPSGEEITRIRRLIHQINGDIAGLGAEERAAIGQAVTVIRKHRAVSLGMPAARPPAPAQENTP